ncbi:hypothetical protein DJ84_15515 [Halorubrum ezzemoulense]|nr:hypothetical protein DJ84_15515 [Halorubrum ezzemoulense]
MSESAIGTEFPSKELADADFHEVTAVDDANLLGHLKAEEEEALEKGEIISPLLLADLLEEFEAKFGDDDARLSFVESTNSGTVLVCLRPWSGDGTEAVVMPAKVER